MSSSLKERIARLGPTRAVDRVRYGSPAALALHPSADLSELKTVSAAVVLARRGIPLLRAKRALEEMLARGRAYLRLPTVENAATLADELRAAGVIATPAAPPETVDVRAIRDRLGLTQEQFALRYGLDLDAVRNWEHGRRRPDTAARSYLRVIAREPERVAEVLVGA
jgi:DNA-binding transcriptional regulator YiaG